MNKKEGDIIKVCGASIKETIFKVKTVYGGDYVVVLISSKDSAYKQFTGRIMLINQGWIDSINKVNTKHPLTNIFE